MNVFQHPNFEHEHVAFFHDADAGLRMIVAIHRTSRFGASGGGCRMWSYASEDEALRDALRLSRAMSYKLALFEMPAGGAKAVILGRPRPERREALMRAVGRAVERLAGRFVIAEDVGTTPADMRVVAEETNYVMGRHASTADATAYGVFVGLHEAARRALGQGDSAGCASPSKASARWAFGSDASWRRPERSWWSPTSTARGPSVPSGSWARL